MFDLHTDISYPSRLPPIPHSTGLKIFTSSSRHEPLNPDTVLDYLKALNDKDYMQYDLVEAYLEHLIMYEQNPDPKYHNLLALTYLNKVTGLEMPRYAAVCGGRY